MAQKRMFSLSVVDTDEFLSMPMSSRLLYYELGMRADDDGFVSNWRKILLFTGLKEDDLKVLISKQFVIPFESGVIVIRHWRMNNYLQNDRTKPTIYQNELKQLGIDENNVYTMDTTCIHSIDKNRIDKISIDKNNNVEVVAKFIEENFKRTISPIEIEKIKYWLENFSVEMIKEAVKKSVLARKMTFNYISGILKNWKTNNITTIEEIQEEKQEVPDLPDWFDKPIEREEISPEQKKELDDIIASFE